ncbi:hypothetical protein AB1Y20_006951 [Prymnesium parvum]|uniref:Uncharacterized protein n=1 Tax=Prymnesium parvum TaxID=97485 RepID=A0AB34J1V1_PRYPA
MVCERSATFAVGGLFFNPASRIIRDLGVLALLTLSPPGGARVLDAMSGTGVRSLRYSAEANAVHVLANERMEGDHPLRSNLRELVAAGRARVADADAVDLYCAARLSSERFHLVDCDGFGTGQPHAAEAWWATLVGGYVYLCATDGLATCGATPHQAYVGYGGAAHRSPACNEAALRLLIGASFREAAARRLDGRPVFAFFHRPSSSFRVMMRLAAPRPPPAAAYEAIGFVARCPSCGETWRVGVQQVGEAAARRPCAHDAPPAVSGPMWVAPMHDGAIVRRMRRAAAERGWEDTEALLRRMEEECAAEEAGALLFYHLGEVQRALAAEGLPLPRLAELLPRLRAAGYGASRSHSEAKALKTSATLADIVSVVRQMGDE